MKKFAFFTTMVILVLVAIFIWWRYYFVFGEGVKAGELNFVVNKGYVFKTWEGRLIQTGYRSRVPGAIQSNEFEFSIASDAVAEQLKLSSGKFVELTYKEYLGALPWRGNTKYIVDSVISISEKPLTSPY